MSMRASAFLAGATVILGIASCTRAPHLLVFNRTGVPLTVQRTPPYETDVTIPPGATHRARFPDSMELTVVAGAATWRYAVTFPPREMARWSRLGTPEFQLQIEPDELLESGGHLRMTGPARVDDDIGRQRAAIGEPDLVAADVGDPRGQENITPSARQPPARDTIEALRRHRRVADRQRPLLARKAHDLM